MECTINLYCSQNPKNVEIKMNINPPSWEKTDIGSNIIIYEDAVYSGEVCIDNSSLDVEGAEVFINGNIIGVTKNFEIRKETQSLTSEIIFENGQGGVTQPFLLLYDLVVISIKITMQNGIEQVFFSDYLPCLSRHKENVQNIEEMIYEIHEFENEKINDLLFSDSKSRRRTVGLLEGDWKHRSYKSILSYIQLIEQIIQCYQVYFIYFKTMPKHTVTKVNELQSYDNVRTINYHSFNWLMKNAEQLKEVDLETALNYRGKNYLPLYIDVERSCNNIDIYENRIILAFLDMVCKSSQIIREELQSNIIDEEKILSKLQCVNDGEYNLPIITVKELHIKYNRSALNKLNNTTKLLQELVFQYKDALRCTNMNLLSFPKKTKIFQEIQPYNQIYKNIIKWYEFGEFSLIKNKVIFQIKTLDKLFEYYCLIEILKMINAEGFEAERIEQPSYIFEYDVDDDIYEHEKDLANTYKFKKDDIYITLYYQPVIHSNKYENEITLFRTTYKERYFTPDFLLKINTSETIPKYAIFDAKYSTRKTIKTYRLDECILKYDCQVSDSVSDKAIKMVWLLQGKVDNSDPVFKFHNSPLAIINKINTSYGIASINTKTNIRHELWKEIKEQIL